MSTLGRNIAFPIYKGNGSSFHDLVIRKSTSDSVVMSLGDKVTGDVYYKDNTLVCDMDEYIMVDGVKYSIVNPPTIVREGLKSDNGDLKGMTKYSFEFYHPMYMLGNMAFSDVAVTNAESMFKSHDRTFSWIGNLTDFVAKLNKNLQDSQFIVSISSSIEADSRKVLSDVLSFNDNTIADALKTAYDTWHFPFVVDVIKSGEQYYSQGKRFLIQFGNPTREILDANNQPFVFHFGKGVGLKNNSRTPRNNKIVTRVAGYGSEQNIPYGYPQIPWTGDPSATTTADGYPIYEGIVGGVVTKLVKHPFTRTHLMPSVYAESVRKKVNSAASDYDNTTPLVDYYDAPSSYPNPINLDAPRLDIVGIETIKPELGDMAILGATPVNDDLTPASGWDDTMDDDGNYHQSYFKITLPQLDFDLYATASITEEMKLNMRSGACIGCTFDIQVDWDDYKKNFFDAQGNFLPNGNQRDLTKYPKSNLGSITVVCKKDLNTYGMLMPNVYQHPAQGDKFVILGISLPSTYITNAEERLDAALMTHMLDNNVYYYDYPLKFDEDFLYNHTDILSQVRPNSVLRFTFGGVEKSLYIKQITIKYGEGVLPKYDITLTDNIEVVLNQIGLVADDVSRLALAMMQMNKRTNINISNTESLQKYVDYTIMPNLESIQKQIDGSQVTYFGNEDPFDSTHPYSDGKYIVDPTKFPASEWDDDYSEHDGDMFYNRETGKGYEFTIIDNSSSPVVYGWQLIQDEDIVQALDNAQHAQDTADGKRRVFICDASHHTPNPPYDVGDLWVNVKYPYATGATYDDEILKCVVAKTEGQSFSINDWSLANGYTAALRNFINGTYADDLADIQNQIDGKAETWYQNTDPSTAWTTTALKNQHKGDIWHNSSTSTINGVKAGQDAIWNGTAWAVDETVPQAVYDEIDGKCAIYVTWGAWGNDLQEKDLFIPAANTTQGGITYKANKVYRCVDKDTPTFQEIAYTDDTQYNGFITKLIGSSGQTKDAAENAIAAIKHALSDGNTYNEGGLILSNLISLGTGSPTSGTFTPWAGISGIYKTSETGTGYKGHGIAAWYGGGMIDKEVSAVSNAAKSLFRFDGSGYVASGNLKWDANGNVTIQGYSINATTLQVGGANVATQAMLDNFVSKAFFNRLFTAYDANGNAIVPNNTTTAISNLKIMVGTWTEQYLSALGLNSEGSGGGTGDVSHIKIGTNPDVFLDPDEDGIIDMSSYAANWNDAYQKRHTHSNKSVLDGITSTKVSHWDAVYGVVPQAAYESGNQLADKNFVNSSISTSTATFRGTNTTATTESAFLTWANGLTHDLNDYVFWSTKDSAGNTIYKRYKYDGSQWVFEYDLNNSSFTSDQWSAINSGITSTHVTKLNGIASGAQVNVIESVKVNGTALSISSKAVDITAVPLTIITGADDLKAIEGLSGTSGFLKKTAANTWALDTTVVLNTRTITAGNGLTGGGDLSANRTINVASANAAITVNADNIQLNVINDYTTTTNNTIIPLAAARGKDLNDRLAILESWFEVDSDGNVKTKDKPNNGGHRGFYTESFVSALGQNSQGGGGGTTDLNAVWGSLTTNTDEYGTEKIHQDHLPIAASDKLGAIKVGSTLQINSSGVLNQKSGVMANPDVYTKVTVDTYGRVTQGGSLLADDIPSLSWSKITSGKPTTLSGYGITNAYTKAETDSAITTAVGRYLPLTGGTMTGNITMGKNAIVFDTTNDSSWNFASANSGIRLLHSVDSSATGAYSNYSFGISLGGYYGIQLATSAVTRNTFGLRYYNPNVGYSDWVTLLHSGNTSLSNGVININGSTITPLTAASSLNANNITSGTINAARLPSLYWANIPIQTTSDNTKTPTFGTGASLNYTNGEVYSISYYQIWATPVAKYYWHDLFALGRAIAFPKMEVSTNGTTWTLADSTTEAQFKKFFANRENQTIQLLDDTHPYVRFTWNGGNCYANQAQWLVIGTTYNTTQATCTIVKEDNKADGTYNAVSTSTLTGDSTPKWIKTTNACQSLTAEGKAYSGYTQPFFRITFSRTSAAGTILSISSIKYLTYRWGNQGCGSEYEYPFNWNENGEVYPIGNGVKSFGFNSARWYNVYSRFGNFSENVDIGNILAVTGNATIGGTLDVTGDITINNGSSLCAKDNGGTKRSVIFLNNSNNLYIGYQTAPQGSSTYIEGYRVYFRYGTSHTLGMLLNSYGNVAIGVDSPSYRLHVGGTLGVTEAATLLSSLSVASGITLTTTKKIYFGDSSHYLELDANGYFHFSHGLYSDSFVSALGSNSQGGGSGADLNAVWGSLTTNTDEFANEKIDNAHLNIASWALAANKPYYTWSEIQNKPSWIGASKPTYAFSEITSKPTTLSGYGITDAASSSSVTTLEGYFTNGVAKNAYHISNYATIAGAANYPTVGDAKAAILAIVTNQNTGVGDCITISTSIVNNWSDDTAAVTASTYHSMMKISGGYNGANSEQYLLSTHGLLSVGVVGRASNAWTNIKWLAWTDGTNASGTWGINVTGSAATLANARTIWGQSFDGSANVDGAFKAKKDLGGNLADWVQKQHNGVFEVGRATNTMCVAIGVTDDDWGYIQSKGKNITSSGKLAIQPSGGDVYINSKVGIGTSSPSYNLHVSGTFRASTNANIGGTLSVGGAATLGSTLSVSGATTLLGNVYINNDKFIFWKDTNGTNIRILDLDSWDILRIGYGTASGEGYNTYLYGKNIVLHYGTSRTKGFELTSAGVVNIAGATNIAGLLSANGNVKTTKLYLYKPNADDTNAVYLTYDSTNSGVHLVGAGLYSDSYVSALGSNSQGGGGGDASLNAVWGSLTTYNDEYKDDVIDVHHIPNLSWAKITNRPTTLSGYGILDAYTKTQADAKYATISSLSDYLPLSGGTLTSSSSYPLTIKSTSTNSYIRFQNSSAVKATVGYYSGLAFVANETTYARIGINDSGTPQYWSSNSSSTAKTLLHSGNSYVTSGKGYINGTEITTISGNAATATTATKLGSSTVGSSSMPIYLSSGTPTQISSFPEAYLSWGGKNIASSYGVIDAAMISELGANRMAFMPAAKVIVEYSRDNGATWLDYEATDTQKLGLTGASANFVIGKSSNGNCTADCKLRITFITGGSLYTVLNKFALFVSTNGSIGSKCTIQARTQQNYEDNVDTWVNFATDVAIGGWSGWNIINTSGLTTYGNTKASQYGQFRFIFGNDSFDGVGTTRTGLSIQKIRGFGGQGWGTPSYMAASGHIYRIDELQNAFFPADIRPKDSNTHYLGYSNARWKGFFSGSGDFSGNVVVGGYLDMTGVIAAHSSIYIDNNRFIYWKDSGGTLRRALDLDSSNNMRLGYGTATEHYNSYIEGYNLYLCYGSAHTTGLTLDSSGNITTVGHTYMANGKSIYLKDSVGNTKNAVVLDSNNNFHLGYGIGTAGYDTHLYGNRIYFRYGTSGTVGLTLGSSGAVIIPSTGSLKIGDCTIEWDSTNQMLKFDKGIYSTGAVSALGSNDDGGGSSDFSEELMWAALQSNTGTYANTKINSGHIPNLDASIITSGTFNASRIPLATSSARGGVKVGYTTNGKNYAVQLSNEQMYVNVPWENTTYESKAAASGGTAVSLVTTGEKYTWNNKQSAISDLSTIRSNATNGNTAYGWGNHASAGYASASSVTTLQGYFTNGVANSATTASKLSTVSKTAWGQTYWTSGGVPDSISGNMSNVGNITMDGYLYMASQNRIYFKSSGNTDMIAMYETAANHLYIGYGFASEGYSTYIAGNTVELRYGTSRTTGLTLDGGDVTVKGKVCVGTGGADSYLASDSATNIYLRNSSGAILVCDGKVIRRSTSLSDVTLGSSTYPWGGVYSTTGTFSSNVSVGGTLGVTGATTLSSTLSVSGAVTMSSNLTVTGWVRPVGNLVMGTSSNSINSNSGQIHFRTANMTDFTKNVSPYIQAIGGSSYGRKRLSVFQNNGTSSDYDVAYSEVFTILANGRVGIGNVAPSEILHVTGNILASGEITASSDERKKNIISDTKFNVRDIASARSILYEWNDDRDKDNEKKIHGGSIAQDWLGKADSFLSQDNDGWYSINYGALALCSAITIARMTINHEDRLTRLEKENEMLKEKVRKLEERRVA